MPRLLVIADDLTGAAEIGGLATRFGLSTQLLRTAAPPPTSCDCVVYDTDSRLLPANKAAEKTAAFALAAKAGAFDLVFKKTDSVLRGEPFVEIAAVAERFGRADVLFVPHNPSRDRCVRDGRYTVGGVPLHRTDFARDPTHPARTDDVITLLRPPAGHALRSVSLDEQNTAGWVIGEASTPDDIADWAERLDPVRQLAAGGADFFEAIVRRARRNKPAAFLSGLPRPLLYVSGTTSRVNETFRQTLRDNGQFLPMPAEVFERGDTGDSIWPWAKQATAALQKHGVAMVAVGEPPAGVAGDADRIGRALAAVAARVAQAGHVATIACEGGATAAALCDFVGWQRFTVDGEIATGIVCLRLRSDGHGLRLVVKPGSYAWPAI
ncbi:MAG: four-carbon acid sugar kinase family protein [Tepidisphaeraceae bacterium]